MSKCECNKMHFETREAANKFVRNEREGKITHKMRPYRCPTSDLWHLTTMPKALARARKRKGLM